MDVAGVLYTAARASRKRAISLLSVAMSTAEAAAAAAAAAAADMIQFERIFEAVVAQGKAAPAHCWSLMSSLQKLAEDDFDALLPTLMLLGAEFALPGEGHRPSRSGFRRTMRLRQRKFTSMSLVRTLPYWRRCLHEPSLELTPRIPGVCMQLIHEALCYAKTNAKQVASYRVSSPLMPGLCRRRSLAAGPIHLTAWCALRAQTQRADDFERVHAALEVRASMHAACSMQHAAACKSSAALPLLTSCCPFRTAAQQEHQEEACSSVPRRGAAQGHHEERWRITRKGHWRARLWPRPVERLE